MLHKVQHQLIWALAFTMLLTPTSSLIRSGNAGWTSTVAPNLDLLSDLSRHLNMQLMKLGKVELAHATINPLEPIGSFAVCVIRGNFNGAVSSNITRREVLSVVSFTFEAEKRGSILFRFLLIKSLFGAEECSYFSIHLANIAVFKYGTISSGKGGRRTGSEPVSKPSNYYGKQGKDITKSIECVPIVLGSAFWIVIHVSDVLGMKFLSRLQALELECSRTNVFYPQVYEKRTSQATGVIPLA
ncbi:uncharacterized protein BDR25DRAFT_350766 [Lindgomyces ingoldianus]|uniref:Uncharacterized protein n=1 Tax=Lindgomyces ingoldianus TaxID=673940 RepID=A0ACB6R9H6_9PLEO|nr:uncharacterized protein BDR25DRAFT_350766 [Lindgomyces ingoldianus]KAF2475390.1 hypothetical protein BDR25DRAFT_350766 [Lindgomyces ingoldianus]